MMSDTFSKPTLYLKAGCPFCMKLRIFVLETGLTAVIETRDFAVGTPEEEAIRETLAPHFEKISFPAAQIAPGKFIAESDAIIGLLAEKAGRKPETLPVYTAYLDGPFAAIMKLWQENVELKKAAAST